MKYRFALLLAGALCLAAAPAFASPITFNFGGPDQTISSPATFTVDGISISAFGIVNGSNRSLYQKDDSASETGLGLARTDDHEINPGQAIIFNLHNLISAGYGSGVFSMGSLQSGEEAEVCVGSSLIHFTCSGPYADNLGGAIGTAAVNWGTDSFVGFLTYPTQPSRRGNYLIGSLTASPVPEPASLFLLATGLLGLCFLSRRRWAGMLG